MAVHLFTGPTALEDFAREWQRAVTFGIPDAENLLVKRVSLDILTLCAAGTAVDTGRARSNWLTSVGAPIQDEIDPFAPGKHLGKGEKQNISAVIALASVVLGTRSPEVPVYITNYAPHIGALNEGNVMLRPENAPINPAFIENAIMESLDHAQANPVDWFYPWTSKMADSIINEWGGF